jgi:hypothetical protein
MAIDLDGVQNSVVSANVEDAEPIHLGSRFTMTRKMGNREQTMTSEITEHQPSSNYAFQVIDGPVRAHGKGTFEPLDGGARTRFNTPSNCARVRQHALA